MAKPVTHSMNFQGVISVQGRQRSLIFVFKIAILFKFLFITKDFNYNTIKQEPSILSWGRAALKPLRVRYHREGWRTWVLDNSGSGILRLLYI